MAAAAGLAAGLSVPAALAQAPTVVRDAGLQSPESVLVDPAEDVYLVSNINGRAGESDDNGFISRLSPEGRVGELKWIEGGRGGVTLHGPTGMAIVGDTLYVADTPVVRMFDRRTGAGKGLIVIPDPGFVNDVAAAPDGTVYVTDSSAARSAVLRLQAGRATVIASGPQLQRPNGVAVLPDGRLVLVAATGAYYTLSTDGRIGDVRRLPQGQLDGVEVLAGGVLLISSWAASAVYRVAPDGAAQVAVGNVTSPADIGYDGKRGRVLIPLLQTNQVVIQEVR